MYSDARGGFIFPNVLLNSVLTFEIPGFSKQDVTVDEAYSQNNMQVTLGISSRQLEEVACVSISAASETPHSKKNDRKTQNETIQIISTGRLVWEKGYIYALEAVSNLLQTHKNIIYSIWGSGPDIYLLNYHIQRLRLTDYCFLKGEGSKAELTNHLFDSDIYLLPSLSEGVPNSILEASATGLPVVSTLVGGIPEVVKHGITGLLSPPANSIEIAANIEKLILDKL
jgi:glycosyltransferase involved in cell wall biosynthesis